MSISGIGQNYYHNNVATVRNTKNVNSTEKMTDLLARSQRKIRFPQKI